MLMAVFVLKLIFSWKSREATEQVFGMGQRRLSGENQVEIFGLVFWNWAEGSSSMAVKYALLDGFPVLGKVEGFWGVRY